MQQAAVQATLLCLTEISQCHFGRNSRDSGDPTSSYYQYPMPCNTHFVTSVFILLILPELTSYL